MLTHKVFKFFSPCLLFFSIKQNTIVVSDNFFYGFPEVLDHLINGVSFTTKFNLLISKKFLVFYLALSKLFSTKTDVFLGIVLLFLMFSFKVLFHPNHLLEQKFQMILFILGSSCLNELIHFLRQNFYATVDITLHNIRTNFLKLGFQTLNFLSKL